VLQAKDTSLTSWKENTVGKQHAGHKTVFGFTGITTDRRASNYNKKAGKCPGRSYGESACCKRCQQRRQRPSAMVEYYTGVAARLTQAASIPEDLTDNELDEVLNAKTSLIKRVITDLQNTADKWVTRDLRLISGYSNSRFAAGSS
jgi:tetrahydromethanopterin S-methyltransferase subunit F